MRSTKSARSRSALKRGGLPVAEVTFRTEASIRALGALAGDGELLVGAGTVIRPEQVDLARDAGARFVVTPGFSPRVVERCRELAMPVIPGVSTASEVIAALDHGCELLKFFPAEASGGAATIRALAGPFPHVRFIPTGGVSAANAPVYLRLPSVAAVGGSWMVAPTLLRARRLRDRFPARRRGRPRRSAGQAMSALTIRPPETCRHDLVALGEVMLRLDPGEGRVRTARQFRVWEGGGEYNVARGLRRCFGMRTAIVTALVENDIGRLLEDLVLQGGVDTSLIRWVRTTAPAPPCATA